MCSNSRIDIVNNDLEVLLKRSRVYSVLARYNGSAVRTIPIDGRSARIWVAAVLPPSTSAIDHSICFTATLAIGRVDLRMQHRPQETESRTEPTSLRSRHNLAGHCTQFGRVQDDGGASLVTSLRAQQQYR